MVMFITSYIDMHQNISYYMVHFLQLNVKPTHIINLAINLFDGMRYYNVPSRNLCQDCLAGSVKKNHKKLT